MDGKWDGPPTLDSWVRSLPWLTKATLLLVLLLVALFVTCGTLAVAGTLVEPLYCRDTATAIPDDDGVAKLDFRCETITFDFSVYEALDPQATWRCDDGSKPTVLATRKGGGSFGLELDCGN